MKSPIKWVGSKRSIVKELLERMPKSFSSYNEPFFGGGTLFFNLTLSDDIQVCINDQNQKLMITYQVIRDHVEELILELEHHKKLHCEEYYYLIRHAFNTDVRGPVKLAGLFLYLNKTCYNGLYRTNKQNKFNTPIGRYKKPAILEAMLLRQASQKLQNVAINCDDFRKITPQRGTMYYLDPPYDEAYCGYTNSLFTKEDQKDLTNLCMNIHDNGGLFMLSNSNTDLIKELYKDFYIESVSSMRTVSCKPTQRKRIDELLIRNF